MTSSQTRAARADLVCEGGGVRGIGLVGAVHALAAAGYGFPRVAGSSAGAVVASMIAALQAAGEPVSRLDELAHSIDYSKFADPTLVAGIPIVGPALSLALKDGLYKGDYLENLLTGLLGDLGVRTFGDLRTGEAPTRYAWSLVVTASDLSRRRLARIPWDLPNYGVDPDEFSVARAVRASSAVPFAFEPVRVSGATWVDGGLLSNFPVELFDRGGRPQWPTFGIRLSAPPGRPPTHKIRGRRARRTRGNARRNPSTGKPSTDSRCARSRCRLPSSSWGSPNASTYAGASRTRHAACRCINLVGSAGGTVAAFISCSWLSRTPR